jgi:hypothetical protein
MADTTRFESHCLLHIPEAKDYSFMTEAMKDFNGNRKVKSVKDQGIIPQPVEADKRPPKAEIIKAYVDAIDGLPNILGIPPLNSIEDVSQCDSLLEPGCLPGLRKGTKLRAVVARGGEGVQVCLEKPERVLVPISFNYLVSKVMNLIDIASCLLDFPANKWATLTHKEAILIAEQWRARCRKAIDAEKVLPVAFKSADCWCFRRLDFDPEPTPELVAPAWDKFREACSAKDFDAVAQWIALLFNPEADRTRYLWLYGSGKNGKSTLANALEMFFSGAFLTASCPSLDDKFWSANLEGKRLVYLSETYRKFPTSNLFKNWTGEPRVHIEKKYQAPYTIRNDAMFLFSSNDLPDIRKNVADMRRVILVKLQELNITEAEKDPNHHRKMADDLPGIINYGLFLLDGAKSVQGYEMNAADELADANDAEFTEPFEEFFDVGTHDDYVSSGMLQQKLALRVGQTEYRRLIADWVKRYRLTYDKVWNAGTRTWTRIYRGMKCR